MDIRECVDSIPNADVGKGKRFGNMILGLKLITECML